jgi:uncharacterized protein (DUF342 family)
MVEGEVGRPERMRGSTLGIQKWRNAHGRRLKAKTGRFSSSHRGKENRQNDGKTIADASDKKVAEDGRAIEC